MLAMNWCLANQSIFWGNSVVRFIRLACSILLLGSAAVMAEASFPADASIYLQAPDGTELQIGHVQFGIETDGKHGITVTMDNERFTEHFLSMRPFRCLQGEQEWFCYLPYPYELQNVVSEDDLSDLAYNLLFIKKTPTEFGIDAWNGLYYQLTVSDDGYISGTLFEGDLNVLQSPPANKYDKPIDLDEFIEGDSSKRLFPSLVIR